MNLANKAVLKILSVAKAIEHNSSMTVKAPREDPQAAMPEQMPSAPMAMPAQEQQLPPLNETPLDQGMILGGADSFDALLGGAK